MQSTNNYINPVDFERILSHLGGVNMRSYTKDDIKFLFELCYWCGLRVSEALSLEWKNVNIDDSKITLEKTKTDKNVEIFMPPKIVLLCEEFYGYCARTHGYEEVKLFPTVKYHALRNLIHKIGKDLSISAWTKDNQKRTGEKTLSHIFRKSIAKDMIRGEFGKKADIVTVSRKLRHRSLSVTQSYLKVDSDIESEFWDQPKT